MIQHSSIAWLVLSFLLTSLTIKAQSTDVLASEWVLATNSAINISGNILTNSAGNGDTRASIATKTQWGCPVPANFEVTVSSLANNNSKRIILGFDAPESDYIFQLRSRRIIVVQREKGTINETVRTVISTKEIVSGDRFKLEQSGGTLTLYKNGVEKLTSINTQKRDGFFYVELEGSGSAVTNVKRTQACPLVPAEYKPVQSNELEVGSALVYNDGIITRTTNTGIAKIRLIPAVYPCAIRNVEVIRIRNFGVGGQQRSVVMGMETGDGRTYTFDLRANGSIIVRENGVKKSVIQARNLKGEYLSLELHSSALILRANFKEELASIKGIANFDEGNFTVTLNGLGTSVDQTRMVRGCPPATKNYSELKTLLDGGFVSLVDDKLRIKFTQEYEMSANSTLPYTIYDWQRNPFSGTFNVSYGANFIEIPLAIHGLLGARYYTLELSGNKGEKYFLRFKTK